MNNAKLAEILKQSNAFKNFFPEQIQENVLNRLPDLSPEKKLELVRMLVKEAEETKKRQEEKLKILETLREELAAIVKSARKETVEIVEEGEREKALDSIDVELSNL